MRKAKNLMKTINESSQIIIDHYQMHADDIEAAVIEDIMRMNNGEDSSIIIENLRGWFEAKTTPHVIMDHMYKDMLSKVNWTEVYEELKLSILPRLEVPEDFDSIEDYERDQKEAAETIQNGDY